MSRKTVYGKTSDLVLGRVRKAKRQWGGAFTPSDFTDIGDLRSVGMVLSRLVKKGTIRRVRRGVYELPNPHPILGTVGAGPDAVLAAIARRDGFALLPSGAESANSLGLSTQVPMKSVFYTSGPSRKIHVGCQEVLLKHANSRLLAFGNGPVGIVFAALWYMGKNQVTPETLKTVRGKLTSSEFSELRRSAQLPPWLTEAFQKLEKAEGHG